MKTIDRIVTLAALPVRAYGELLCCYLEALNTIVPDREYSQIDKTRNQSHRRRVDGSQNTV